VEYGIQKVITFQIAQLTPSVNYTPLSVAVLTPFFLDTEDIAHRELDRRVVRQVQAVKPSLCVGHLGLIG